MIDERLVEAVANLLTLEEIEEILPVVKKLDDAGFIITIRKVWS